MHVAVCVYPETNRIYSINQKDNFTMVLNIYILDIYLTHFLDFFFLSAVEVCMQQGTGAALLRQTSAVLQSTTSLKNTCAYLWQLLTDYTSAVHVTLHNTLAQSLLVFLVKTCYVPEISNQFFARVNSVFNIHLFLFIYLNHIDRKTGIHASGSLSGVCFKLCLQICNNWQFPWVLLNCVLSRKIELNVLEMHIREILLSVHECRV